MRGKNQRKSGEKKRAGSGGAAGRKSDAGAGRGLKSRILYAAAVLVTLVVAVTHDAEFPRFLLGFEILLAVALYVCVRMLASGLEAEVYLPSTAMRRGELFEIRATLRNRRILPAADVTVEVVCRDMFTDEVNTLRSPAMVDGRGTAEVVFRLKAEHCGVISILNSDVRVKDYLGLFCRECAVRASAVEYTSLPQWGTGEDEETRTPGKTAGEGDGDVRSIGDDLSEIGDIREYRKGDMIHSIHWKLSARFDQLMVRDPGDTSETTFLIFLDLYPGENGVSRGEMDMFYDKAAAMSWEMLRAGLRHDVLWAREQILVRYTVRDEASFREMLLALIHTPLSGIHTDLDTLYKERSEDETYREAGRLSLAQTRSGSPNG